MPTVIAGQTANERIWFGDAAAGYIPIAVRNSAGIETRALIPVEALLMHYTETVERAGRHEDAPPTWREAADTALRELLMDASTRHFLRAEQSPDWHDATAAKGRAEQFQKIRRDLEAAS